jgi:FkbM family methyltransferase
MIKSLKKLARTLVTFFPFTKDVAYLGKRWLRQVIRSSVEDDFNVIDLFPDREDLLFLDIGTNQGAALEVFLRKSKHSRIYSFEPNPEVFKKAYKRFRRNPRVKLSNVGLGEETGRHKLYVPVYRGYEFDGWGSLSPDFDDTWFSETILFYDPRLLWLRELQCEIQRLDELNLDPFFMKVDVQGAELAVVRGGRLTIQRSHPIILLESGEHDEQIRDYLAPFGYRIYRYSKGKFFEGECGSPNSFFMTDEKYQLLVPEAVRLPDTVAV